MATTSRSADLTSGPMLQKIILFSVPLAASSILQLLFNAADVVVVGRFAGSTALAAVGSNGALINLLVNLFVGLSLGANVVAARCFGARDEKGVQDTVHTAVALGLVSGVLLAVVGFCAARGLLERMAQTVHLDEPIRTTVQCCEVTELILLFSHVIHGRRTAPPPSATSLLVARAVAYLQANYTDPQLNVAQLARYTYTSREHLSRVFKEYTLESVHGYLTNLRMQHCRNALAAGMSVLDACSASGFTNYSSFVKSFRALYGITPTEYRAQLRIPAAKG